MFDDPKNLIDMGHSSPCLCAVCVLSCPCISPRRKGGAEGAGRVSAGNLGGGGYFLSGPKCPPSVVLRGLTFKPPELLAGFVAFFLLMFFVGERVIG